MKITVAPDSLKECLGAPAAGRAIARGVREAAPDAEIIQVPVADGGEGTTVAIVEATGGELRSATVSGPLGEAVEAKWGLCEGGRTAVIEMAEASGLERVPRHLRNPMRTSTRGTGELIREALDAGAEKVIVGVGGSATVDGGTGMASALGIRFLDARARPIENCCGGRLEDVERIEAAGRDPRLSEVEVVVASDVTNPLLGPNGAARVYGPQKGASADQVEALERGLSWLAEVARRDLGQHACELPGAGAAGGLGWGLAVFLGARLRSGARTVVEAVGLREKMCGSTLAFTAEGRLDRQSAFGKATACVAELAGELEIPVVALAGSLEAGFEELYGRGLTAAFAIADGPMSLHEATEDAERLLAKAAESVMRCWLAGGGHADA